MKKEYGYDRYLEGIGMPPTLQLPFYTGPAVQLTNGIILACNYNNDWPEVRKLLLRLLRIPDSHRYLKLGSHSKLKTYVKRIQIKEYQLKRRKDPDHLWTFYATPCSVPLDLDLRQSLSYPELPNSRPVNRGFRSASVPFPASDLPPVDTSQWFPSMDTTCPVLSRAPSVLEDVELPVSRTVDVTSACHAVRQMSSIPEEDKPEELSALDVTTLLPMGNFSWPRLCLDSPEDVKPPVTPVGDTAPLLPILSGQDAKLVIPDPEDSKPDVSKKESVHTPFESSGTSHSSTSLSPDVAESVTDPLSSSRSRSSTPFTDDFLSVPFTPLPLHRILEHQVEQQKLELEQKNKKIIELQGKLKNRDSMLRRRNEKVGQLEMTCREQQQLEKNMKRQQEREALKEEKREIKRNEVEKLSNSLEHAFAKIEKLKAEAVAMRRRADEAEEKLCEMEDLVQKKLVVWDNDLNKFSDHCFEHIVRFSKLGIPGKRLPKALECAASFAGVKLDRTPSAGTCRRATLPESTDSGRVKIQDDETSSDVDTSRRSESPDAYSDCSL